MTNDDVKVNQTKAFGLATEVMKRLQSSQKKDGNFINQLDAFLKMRSEKLNEIFNLKIEETIESLLQNFGDIAKAKNIPLYYTTQTGTDPDIEKWLPNAELSQNPTPDGLWKNVDTKNGTSEKTMLKTAQKMSLSQAIKKFTEMLEEGTFDKLETYRIIFLEEMDANGNSLELVCRRSSDGKLSLYVSKVDPVYVWNGSGRAWFEKQNA